jgi:glycosyltransferase involved in cell wall biosynthesis
MKILWLINIPLPEASILMNEKPGPFGGWLINAAKDISVQDNIELSIAFPKNNIDGYSKIIGKKITYYVFKKVNDKNKKLIENNNVLKNMVDEINPDLVHIHGTELAHTLAMINVCSQKKIETIISIQGLVSIIEKHMYASLPFKAVYGATLRNLLRKDNIVGLRKLFQYRGKNEVEAIRKTNHIIGRTTWDKACSLQINPQAKYYFCNESIREEFYNHSWDINKCEKHSIFLSQVQYPIKGLHYVLEAMPAVLNNYPDAKLYISGKDITSIKSYKNKLLMTYYGKYIKKMIKKLKIEHKVIFTGPLNENEMCDRFLKSHLFISPSTIENESNSLSEAKMLGVPSIASYVGGVIDRISHNEDGFFYQHDAPYMLSYYICEIFNNDDLALSFSKKAKEHAAKINDRAENTKRLVEIYMSILP